MCAGLYTHHSSIVPCKMLVNSTTAVVCSDHNSTSLHWNSGIFCLSFLEQISKSHQMWMCAEKHIYTANIGYFGTASLLNREIVGTGHFDYLFCISVLRSWAPVTGNPTIYQVQKVFSLWKTTTVRYFSKTKLLHITEKYEKVWKYRKTNIHIRHTPCF